MKPQRSCAGARALPRELFVSRDAYDRESERIFSRRWLHAGLAAAVPEPGRYVVVEVEDESVLIVRGRDGQVRCFYNVCRHRGTRLCDGGAGTFSKYIVCPYHAWAYELSGALAAAPNMDGVDGFDRDDLPLRALATHVWEGIVFVNFDESPAAFTEAFASIASRFAAWRLAELVPVHRTEYDVAANWKLLFQNYSECYHCPSLHPALNRLTPYRDSENDLEEGPALGGPMRLSEGSASMTVDGRACAAPLAGPPGSDRLVWYYVLFPSMFLSIMPDYALVHRVRRRGPGQTTVECEWLFHPSAVERDGFDPTRAVEFWDMTNRQDWRICEQAQLGIESRAYEPGPYADLESMVAALDREYLRALGPEG